MAELAGWFVDFLSPDPVAPTSQDDLSDGGSVRMSATLPSYLISSGGEDGEFDTDDDIAIRFSMDHEQLERINTFGLEELELQTQQALQVASE